MTKLSWSQNQRYELGVDRGVLYVDSGAGVAWNGLKAVEESSVGADRNERYFEGIKYTEDIGGSFYQATLKAYTYPQIFNSCLGTVSVIQGFELTGQPKKTFDLSYRSLIGTIGYKIHLVYNITASKTTQSNKTLSGNTADPKEFSWKLDAVPPSNVNFKPTAHFVIDSTRTPPGILSLVEAMIYGTASAEPRLPSVPELLTLFR